jgi:hypothetical protein
MELRTRPPFNTNSNISIYRNNKTVKPLLAGKYEFIEGLDGKARWN